MFVYNKREWIYIRGEFTRKKCKTAILLYCFHTAGVVHILIENLKSMLKENQIMKEAGFIIDQWSRFLFI